MSDNFSIAQNWLLLLVCLILPSSESFAQLNVFPARRFDVGIQPTDTAMADFNGDGLPDIACSNRGSLSTVLLNLGSGRFSDPIAVSSAGLESVFTGDVNIDGWQDIVFSNGRLVLGKGDGTFQPSTVVPSATSMNTAVVADTNLDGFPDLLGVGSNSFTITLGNGDGTFKDAISYTSSSRHLASADLNGDLIPDVITADGDAAEVTIWIGNGDGSFSPTISYPVVVDPNFVELADFNNDGVVDYAVTNFQFDNTISTALGNGDGTFSSFQNYEVGDRPIGISAADFDEDGYLDLAVVNEFSADVSILTGLGDGSFLFSENLFVIGRSLVTGDFDGDEKIDLVVAEFLFSGDSGDIQFVKGIGDGTFLAPRYTVAGQFTTNPHHAAAELSGDGITDIAAINTSEDSIVIWRGLGDGTFTHLSTVGCQTESDSRIVAKDINDDGCADILISDSTEGGRLRIFLGLGLGEFIESDCLNIRADCFEVVDLDSDGFLDILTADTAGGQMAVFRGNGDSTFEMDNVIEIADQPFAIVVDDLNCDSILDFATANAASNQLSVYLGDGDLTFTKSSGILSSDPPVGIDAGDFNGDSMTDLLFITGQEIAIALGRAEVGFEVPFYRFVDDNLASIASADLNQDGLSDVIVEDGVSFNDQITNVHLLLGTKNIDACELQRYARIGDAACSLADFDGDSSLDISRIRNFSGDIVVMINQFPHRLLLGDVNLDGFVSLLDVAPFVALLTSKGFLPEADLNQDGVVDLLDVAPFVTLLSGN